MLELGTDCAVQCSAVQQGKAAAALAVAVAVARKRRQ